MELGLLPCVVLMPSLGAKDGCVTKSFGGWEGQGLRNNV